MKCPMKTIVAAFSLAIGTFSLTTADACDRGGRGRIGITISRSPARHYVRPVSRNSQPAYPSALRPRPLPDRASVAAQAGQPAVVVPTNPSPQTSFAVASPQSPTSTVTANAQISGDSQPAEDVAQTALQLLGSMSQREVSQATSDSSEQQIPQFAPSVSQSHIGVWKVDISDNQSVKLTLNADDTFVWTATKQGKASTFNGEYRLKDGLLKLVRKGDLQQMSGTWKGKDSQFIFQLQGSSTAGLGFTRS